MSIHSVILQEKEASKTPKRLYYNEVVEMVHKAFRSKNLVSKSSHPPKPPKETTIEVTFIKQKNHEQDQLSPNPFNHTLLS
jgi:hypothetical protein